MYLENLEVLSNAEYTNAPKNTIASGTVGVTTVMWTDRATADAYTDGNLIVLGRVYVRIDTDFTGAMSVWNPIKWELFDLSPTHNTISLDSSGDKAVKYFLALGKDSDNNAYGVVASKEIDFDVDSGDTGLFEQLIDGTDLDDNGNIVKTDVSYINLNYKMEN